MTASPAPVFIFDLGKVLVDFDYSIAARKITTRSRKTPADLDVFLSASPLLIEYESGRLTQPQFFEAMRDAVDFQGDATEFGGYFADIFSEIHGMIALQDELRRRGFKTYIFSNTNDLAIGHIRRNFPFFEKFDGYIFSYEVGAMKPESKIYSAMEAMCGRQGSDLIYLDDRRENIEGGAARGWRTILHQSPEASRAMVEKFLAER